MAKRCVQLRLLRNLPNIYRGLNTVPSPSIYTTFNLPDRLASAVRDNVHIPTKDNVNISANTSASTFNITDRLTSAVIENVNNSTNNDCSATINLTKSLTSAIIENVTIPTNTEAPTRFSFTDMPVLEQGVVETPMVQNPPTEVLDLKDGKKIFSSMSSTKLLHSNLTLQMAAFEPMVDIGMWAMNSNLMKLPMFKKLVFGIVERTFYEHFCAGEDLEAVGRTTLKLRDSGLKGMLDYGLEHADDNESCDQNFQQFLQTIQSTKVLPSSSVSFVVTKITAICPISLLKRVSDQLRWEAMDSSISLPWKQRTLPIFSETSPLYHTQERPTPLTIEEERDLERAHERLRKLCEACVEADVPLLIDAEDTIVQPAIDYMTYWAAIQYHKGDDPVVLGTMQAYLKDAKDRLIQTKIAAEKIGVPMGFKLVRGAYMSSESKLAASLGVDSPIHDSLEQTHKCYNDCASFMIEKVANKSGAVVLGTHNVESGKLAAAKAMELGIGKENRNFQFAQLYGMSEVFSFALRNAGFQVSKYLPFGNIELIMPYLLRRAEENRGLLSTSYLDRQLMRKELVRRIKS